MSKRKERWFPCEATITVAFVAISILAVSAIASHMIASLPGFIQ